ncbi:two-component system, NtrC family, sensor kinase [Planctomycetaceae bacterium]|nr:two-component system, NtrC family, sensor kinase [Planctomycetaceae bacterium]
MSLRFKILIGVALAFVLLASAMTWLGVQAVADLKKASEEQQKATKKALTDYQETQRATAAKSVQTLVIAWVKSMAGYSELEVFERLRDPDNGFNETAIITKKGDGKLDVQAVKPEGSSMQPGEDERKFIQVVFDTREAQFSDDLVFYPYPQRSDKAGTCSRLMRLQLSIRRPPTPELPVVESPNFTWLAFIAIITLAVSMIGVFVLLTSALRRLVLKPLDNVLENSKMIVKGTSGLEVRGLMGKGGDEVETLVAAFNGMFAELKAYQADLEGKVKDATRTIQKQQQSLVIAQRLAATGTLAAGLAHEVNNPLSGMLNAARRLKMREGLDERARDYIGLIEEGLGRIEELMKQILDFSRRRDMKPERFEALRPYRRAMPLVKHRLEKRKIQLEEEFHTDLPQVYGNEEELSQVFMNLLINASDAAPEGGTVRATITKNARGGVDYAIEDNGTGVPDDIKDRIFAPFFTTKEPGKGTGLGLSIVHTIVDNHGGVVRVEKSEKLGGARFVIDLPPADKQESRRIERA